MNIKKEDVARSEVVLFERKPYLIPSYSYLRAKQGLPLGEAYAITEHWMTEEASKSTVPTKPYDALRSFLSFQLTFGQVPGHRVTDSGLLQEMTEAIRKDLI